MISHFHPTSSGRKSLVIKPKWKLENIYLTWFIQVSLWRVISVGRDIWYTSFYRLSCAYFQLYLFLLGRRRCCSLERELWFCHRLTWDQIPAARPCGLSLSFLISTVVIVTLRYNAAEASGAVSAWYAVVAQ